MRSLLLSIFMMLLCMGCSEGHYADDTIDEGFTDGSTDVVEMVELQVKGDVGGSTRVTDSAWDNYDKIGIYMYYTNSTYELVSNIEYETESGDGNFTPYDEDEEIYYPNSASNVNLFAYYPYSSSMGSKGVMSLNLSSTNQHDEEKIDILRAEVSNITLAQRADVVTFSFSHRLSKVSFLVYPGNGFNVTDLFGMSVKLSHQATEASYSVVSDEITVESDYDSEVTLPNTLYGTYYSSSAVLLPETTNSECMLTIDLQSGEHYEMSFGDVALEAGQNVVCSVSVNQKGIETISTNIIPWGDAIEMSGESDESYIAIFDEADLQAFRTKVNNGTYSTQSAILMSDITLSEASWTPIGNDVYPYVAHFNGNHKSISGLKISETNSSAQGLFGVVGDGIQEVTISDLTIVAPEIVTGSSCGAIAGITMSATLASCSVEGGYVTGADYVGGVVGMAISTVLRYCTSTATVTASGANTGTLVGTLRDGSIVIE